MTTSIDYRQYLSTGLRVSTPDSGQGLVAEVWPSEKAFVVWGDNSRKAYTHEEQQTFRVLDDLTYQVHTDEPGNGFVAQGGLVDFGQALIRRKKYEAVGELALIAELAVHGTFIRWVTPEEITSERLRP